MNLQSNLDTKRAASNILITTGTIVYRHSVAYPEFDYFDHPKNI